MHKHYYFFLLFFFFLIGCYDGFAQFSGVRWDYLMPSNSDGDRPWFRNAVASNDGGVFLVGGANGYRGSYWDLNKIYIVKLDSEGNPEWQKELANSTMYITMPLNMGIVKMRDGGVVISVISGSVTMPGHHGVDSFFSGDGESRWDIRLIKYSASGLQEWERFIGGGRSDVLGDMTIDPFGNILLCGATTSINGDFLGKRRYFFQDSSYSGNFNSSDAFIAKISPKGDLLKIQCFGGTLDDGLNSITLKSNNGYLAVGLTKSNDLDVSGHGGGADQWIVNIDTSLNLIKQKCIGDAFDQKFNYIAGHLGGSFLITGPDSIIRIDSAFNIVQKKKGIEITSAAFIDSEKNIYQPAYDTIIKYDTLFNILWKKRFPMGENGDRSEFYKVVDAGGSNLIFVGFSSWRCSGCWTFFTNKARAVKFSDSYNYVTGKIFADGNKNLICDVGEKVLSGVKVEVEQQGQITMGTSLQYGTYNLPLDTGAYTIKVVSNNSSYGVSPVSKKGYFPLLNKSVDSVDFALQPLPNKKDLSINILPLNIARPGFPVQYQLICTNRGTETISHVQVKFLRNPRVSFISSTPAVSSSVADTMIWNIGSFRPFDTVYIHLNMKIAAPPTVNNTDTLLFKSFAFPFAGDETRDDNQSFLFQRVQGSFDPNDKTETHGGIITPEQLAGNEYLTYLIRFQNTGTDTAFHVMIRDTLQNKLDWSSFEMIGASHSYHLYMIRPGVLEWSFPNILLVDSNRNEPASHGFVAYRIKPKPALAVGDTVLNRAHIFFDYNLPVITNYEQTILRNSLVTSVIDLNNSAGSLLIYPNPSKSIVTVIRKGRVNGVADLRITDINGRLVYAANYGKIVANEFNRQVDIAGLPAGFYVLHLRAGTELYSCKLVIK